MRIPARLSAALFVAAFAVTPAVVAQTAMAQATTPQNAAPAADAGQISEQDKQFLTDDAQGSAYELAIANLTLHRTSRKDVKAYAAKVVADHKVYNQALQELAASKGVTLPTTMNAADQKRYATLDSRLGRTADDTFIKEAIRINADDKKTSAQEASSTMDPDIKAFLSKFEATDAAHEKMALALR